MTRILHLLIVVLIIGTTINCCDAKSDDSRNKRSKRTSSTGLQQKKIDGDNEIEAQLVNHFTRGLNSLQEMVTPAIDSIARDFRKKRSCTKRTHLAVLDMSLDILAVISNQITAFIESNGGYVNSDEEYEYDDGYFDEDLDEKRKKSRKSAKVLSPAVRAQVSSKCNEVLQGMVDELMAAFGEDKEVKIQANLLGSPPKEKKHHRRKNGNLKNSDKKTG